MQCIQLGTRFIVETLAHAKEKASLFDLVASLKPLYHSHMPGSRWFLELMLANEMEWPRQLLFACTTQDTREVFASLVVSVIQGLIEAGERGLYLEYEDADEVEMEELDDDGEVVIIHDEKKRRVSAHFTFIVIYWIVTLYRRTMFAECFIASLALWLFALWIHILPW